MSTPYTYLIGWSSHNLWYYGVQYRKNANPRNLWKTYFTSSKAVKNTREKLGEPDVVEVRKTFATALPALRWESNVLQRLDAAASPKWLNQHNSNGKFNVATSERWNSDEARTKQSNLLRSLHQSDEFTTNRLKARHTPSNRAKQSKLLTEMRANPTFEQSRRTAFERTWTDTKRAEHKETMQDIASKLNRSTIVYAEGRTFDSIQQCATFYNRSHKWVRNQLKRGEFQTTTGMLDAPSCPKAET